MTRRKKLLILVGAAPLLLISAVLLYLNFADLSGWRDTVAGILSESMGRELTIDGVFEPDIGLTTSITIGDISLANAEWSSEPIMVRVDRLAFEVDLLSLVFGPMRIHSLELEGANVLLEVAEDGRGNWEFDTGGDDEDGGEELDLRLARLAVKGLQLSYRDAASEEPLDLQLTRLESVGDEMGMHELSLAGRFADQDLGVTGRLGTLSGLLNVTTTEHDLAGHLGEIEFESAGRIADLTTLGGADLTARVHGADLGAVGEVFDLADIGSGAFTADLGVKAAAEGYHVDIGASGSNINAEISGAVDSLMEPRIVDVTVEASGSDVATIGALTGVEDLPSESFAISGRLRWEGFPISVENLEVQVGDNSLSANGVVGRPPLMIGTDFVFDGEGPDISAIAALAGVSLPRDSFSVGGRLVRLEAGVGIQGVQARVGRNTLEVDGTVGDPPEYAGTTLTIHGEGPNLAYFQNLAGTTLPSAGFEIDGTLTQGDGAITLESVRARLGANRLRIAGQLTTESHFAGTDLRLQATGPDVTELTAIAGITGVPAEPYTVVGNIRVLDNGYRVKELTASLGSLAVSVDGFVAPPPALLGSDLQIHVEDSNLSHPALMAGLTGLPRDSLTIDTRVRIGESGYQLDDFNAVVGDIETRVDGLVGPPPELNGTNLRIEAHGPRVAALGPYLEQPNLPSVPFSVSGGARVIDTSILFDQLVVEIAGNRVAVTGTVMPSDTFAGTDLEFGISGPDLRSVGNLAAGFVDLPELPAENFSLSGRVSIDEGGYVLEDIQATLAKATAQLGGRIGRPPEFVGTDVTVSGDGPNASLFSAVTGVTVPVAPFRLSGRVERLDSMARFHSLRGQLGQHQIRVDGTLGDPPKLIGTDLEVHAEGPSLMLVRELSGFEHLPDRPYSLDGRFDGTTERFSARDLEARIGPSDLQGSFTIDITGKPEIEAHLTSDHLDLRRRLERHGTEEAPEPSASEDREFLISDEAFDLSILHQVDAEVAIRFDEVVFLTNTLYGVDIDLQLEDGRLEIKRLSAVGEAQGTVTGDLLLEPDNDGYRLRTRLAMQRIRLDLPGTAVEPADQPPVDIDIDIEALGATPHGLASTANGRLQIVVGSGVMDNSIADLVAADILVELLDALNPFAGQEESTELQCTVLAVNLEDGHARLEPLAIQTNKMTMLGKGSVNLGTEELDLEWVTKPRKGIGLSASMITNPYIKLGGTLSDPSIQLKELQAVASTSAAVATLGVSLVAKGMYDRVTAEKKVCQEALEKIGRRSDDKPKKSKKKRR